MLLTLKNAEIESLSNALIAIFQSDIKLNNKFGFRASLNIKVLEPYIVQINKVKTGNKYINEFVDYRDKKLVGIKEQFPDYRPEEDQSFRDDLKNKFPEVEREIAEFNVELHDMLQLDVEIALQMINEDDLPNDLNGNLFMALTPMVNKET